VVHRHLTQGNFTVTLHEKMPAVLDTVWVRPPLTPTPETPRRIVWYIPPSMSATRRLQRPGYLWRAPCVTPKKGSRARVPCLPEDRGA